MAGKMITMRFEAKCKGCGNIIPRLSKGYWKKGEGCRCPSCGEHPSDSSPSKSPARPTAAKTAAASGKCNPVRVPGDDLEVVTPGPEFEYACGRTAVLRWDSPSQELDHAMNQGGRYACTHTSYANEFFAKRLCGNHEWADFLTRESVLDRLVHPQPDALAAIEQFKEELVGRAAPKWGRSRRCVRGLEFGDDIDPDRFASRDPMMWSEVRKAPTAARRVKIAVVVGLSGCRRRDDLLYRGAAVLALSEHLQSQGISVEIDSMLGSTGFSEDCSRGRQLVSVVPVKRSDCLVDHAMLMAHLCEIGYMRVVRLVAMMKAVDAKPTGSLGMPTNPPAEMLAEYDFVCGVEVLGAQSAEAWLTAQIEKMDGKSLEQDAA